MPRVGCSVAKRHDGSVALTPCSDLSAAGWIMFSDRLWQQLVCFGPEGFPAYARLRFLPDPAYEGQSENDVDVDEDAPTETALLRAALQTLARHTRTPEDCYFCLWEGWGSELQGGGGVFVADWQTRTVRPGPRRAPFPPSVLARAEGRRTEPRVLPVPGVIVRLRRLGGSRGVAGSTPTAHARPRVHLAGRSRLVHRQRRRPALGRDRSRLLGN